MNKYEEALAALNKLTGRHGTLSYVELGGWVCENCQTVRSALQLAQEAEQLRKELDELARGLIIIHEDDEGDYDFIKFKTTEHYKLAKKVSENGNA